MSSRALPVLAILILGAAADPLPPGVERQGDVLTMQPIGDSDAERRSGTARVLSGTDHDVFARAFDAAAQGNWPEALALANSGRNPVAKALIQWRYLQDRNAGARFEEIDGFLKAYPDWPRRGALQARAEEAMAADTPPAAVIAWYGGRSPISAAGMIRLGEALIATGQVDRGRWLVREGWAAGVFEPGEELRIVQKNGAFLTPNIDQRRLDNLIWADQFTAAHRELARVDDTAQRLGKARMALHSDPRHAERILSELTPEIAGDGRILYERVRTACKAGDFDAAAELMTRPALRELFKTHPGALWAEANLVAREMLKSGKAALAYRLVNDTGMSQGNEFAEAEFLAGWIALRHLHDLPAALAHFNRLASGVSRPISLSRAQYWLGRTYEAMGDNVNAYKRYEAAARAPETFYGQLALTRIDATPTMHLAAVHPEVLPAAPFERDDLVKAMRVLGDLGAQDLLRSFALHYLERHPDAAHARQLAQMLTEIGFRDVAVRVAKTLGYDGPVLHQYSYPVIPIPDYRGPAPTPEPALVHAIIRQETEFDPQSVSRANARGIMQLTHGAARANARRAGLPYRPNALTTDAPYNMQLGMSEISGYLANWSNSLVVSAAAYNAGEANARRWIQAFGDPRTTTDAVDWIESITFGETRNYVQRVVENLEVYRARLAGHDVPLRIIADLYASPPQVRVLAPPPPPPAPAAPAAPANPPRPRSRSR